MGKGSFWVIDGVKVKKKSPFVFQTIAHHQTPEKQQLEKEGSHINVITNEQMARNFFADNIQQLPNHRIDYGTFRNSASSLRDFYLFGPPPVTQSTNQLFYQGQEIFMNIGDSKKSIFVNQFVAFSYKENT